MKKTFLKKSKKFAPYFIAMVLLSYLSCLAVYQASFLPNGYGISAQQKNELTIQAFTIIGKKDMVQTFTFSKQDEWKMEEIKYEIQRQKEALWLLFTTISISTTLIVMRVRNGKGIWKAIFQSNLIFAILFPLIPLVSAWQRIQSLISL